MTLTFELDLDRVKMDEYPSAPNIQVKHHLVRTLLSGHKRPNEKRKWSVTSDCHAKTYMSS